MENLFLEILRNIDFKVHGESTDFYYFPLNYYKLILRENNITNDQLIEIYKSIPQNKLSLFHASKTNVDNKTLSKVNFDFSNIFFYKGRQLIFLICYFLNFMVGKSNINLEIEKIFFNFNDKYNLISTFDFFIKHSFNKKPLIDIYNNNLSDDFDNLIKSTFESENEYQFESYDIKNSDLNLLTNFKNSITLFLNNNKIESGIKELSYHNFDTQILYIMLSILTTNLNEINLSMVYFNIQKL